jgi:hypothetical protein
MSNQNTPRTQSPLALLQARFSLFSAAGSFYVIDEDEVAAIKNGTRRMGLGYMRRPDAELAITRFLESQPVPSDVKETIKQFWRNPNTKVYTGVAFHPTEKDPNILNLWVPSPVVPRKGDFSAIRAFLDEVICDSDQETFDYLLHYLAHMVQKPEEKPGVAIVFLGGQGTGKGVLGELLRRIWPSSVLLSSDVKRIVAGFNADLERAYVVFLDEALFVGDKASTERLKSLITELHVQVEQKYEPSRMIRSVHRFFAASNNRHFADIDSDDRRFFFVQVSSKRQQDLGYFEKLVRAMDDPTVISAFVQELMSIDLKKFNVRARPKTNSLAQQKVKSLRGFERFWFEVLMAGDLGGSSPKSIGLLSYAEQWDKPRFIGTARLIDLIKNADPQLTRYGMLQEAEILALLKRLCPTAKSKRRMDACGSSGAKMQQRGVDLPSLDSAREHFEQFLGISIDWESGAASSRKQIPATYVIPTELDAFNSTEAGEENELGVKAPDDLARIASLATPKENNKNKHKEVCGESPGKDGKVANSSHLFKVSNKNVTLNFEPYSSPRLSTEADLRAFILILKWYRKQWDLESIEKQLWVEIQSHKKEMFRIFAALRTVTISQPSREECWMLKGIKYKTREGYVAGATGYLKIILSDFYARILPDLIRLNYFLMKRSGYCGSLISSESLRIWRIFEPQLMNVLESLESAPPNEFKSRGCRCLSALTVELLVSAEGVLADASYIGDPEVSKRMILQHKEAMGCAWGYYEDPTCMGLAKNEKPNSSENPLH